MNTFVRKLHALNITLDCQRNMQYDCGKLALEIATFYSDN